MVWFGLIEDREVLGFFVFVFKGFMYFVVKILNSFVFKKVIWKIVRPPKLTRQAFVRLKKKKSKTSVIHI